MLQCSIIKTEAYSNGSVFIIIDTNVVTSNFLSLNVNFHKDEFHVRYSMINTKSAKHSVIGEKINGII